MFPETSEVNLTPTSTAEGSLKEGIDGIVLLGQIVHGHCPGGGDGGVTVSGAVRVPLPEAVMVTWVDAATALVVTGKLALVDPAGTVTLAGTVAAAALLLERVTCSPPLGADPLRVTVP